MHIHVPVSNYVYISRVCSDSYIHLCVPVFINYPCHLEIQNCYNVDFSLPQLSDVQNVILLTELSQFHFVEILHTVHNVSIFVMNEAWWGIIM